MTVTTGTPDPTRTSGPRFISAAGSPAACRYENPLQLEGTLKGYGNVKTSIETKGMGGFALQSAQLRRPRLGILKNLPSYGRQAPKVGHQRGYWEHAPRHSGGIWADDMPRPSLTTHAEAASHRFSAGDGS